MISNASDRQTFHVRTFQAGPYAEIAQFILNELSAARVACSIRRGRRNTTVGSSRRWRWRRRCR